MPNQVIGLDSASQANFTAADLDAYKTRGLQYIELYQKWSTPALAALIHSKGLGIAPIFEMAATRALSGWAGGYQDALTFRTNVPKAFGVPVLPPNVAPAWTVDFDADLAQQSTVLDYGRGWKSGMTGYLRCRVYANGAICQAAKAASIVDFTWVTGGKGMRGTLAFLNSGDEDEYQEVGDKENLGGRFGIDSDVAVNPDLSWIWWPDGDPRQLALPRPQVAAVSVMPDLKAAQAELGVVADGRWGVQTAAAFAAYYQGAR